jgi:hypothetical protein
VPTLDASVPLALVTAGGTEVFCFTAPPGGVTVIRDVQASAAAALPPVAPILHVTSPSLSPAFIYDLGTLNEDVGHWSAHWVGYAVVAPGASVFVHNGNALSGVVMAVRMSGDYVTLESL